MHVWKKIGIAASLTTAAAISIAIATPASADTAAQPGDAVGVGSDTLQNAADFVFDGAPGTAGAFNTFAASARVDNVFATGDANGRAVYDGTCGTPGANGLGTYCGSVTSTQVANNNTAPNTLAGSVILRAGTAPVVRPNGSGKGVAALINDSPGGLKYDNLPTDSIQYARMSRLPTSGEETSCDQNASGCGALHVFQAATDTLGIAHVAKGFDGPAGLSAQQLYDIYTCKSTATTWNQVGGTSTATIHPLIPQSGSGTRTFFLADIASETGNGATFTPGDCVRTVQEHDPTGIYGDSSPADAIEPFSGGKLSLINSGYFANGAGYSGTGANSASYPDGAYTPGFLTLENGTPSDGGKNYSDVRGLYFVVRQADYTSTTPFEPGSTLNFVQALFSDSQSAIQSSAGQAQIMKAGFTPDYVDCGPDPTSC